MVNGAGEWPRAGQTELSTNLLDNFFIHPPAHPLTKGPISTGPEDYSKTTFPNCQF